ncbi:collagenase [Indiicoccus explosivorum]|uniref:collagenase n=1 Tax=Indiicoccus explosivorum TaxID=1917864 RepID=UPI000B4448EB|nr:collagenase [Indiicoccus explosivorum]
MAIIKKFLLFLLLLSVLSVTAFGLVFNQNLAGGLIASGIICVFSLVLFGISCWGIGRGGLPELRLKNRLETVGLLMFSLYLGLIAGMIGAANTAAEFMNEGDLHAGDKLLLVARDVLKLPIHEKRITQELNGVLYLFPAESREDVAKFDALLQAEQDRLESFFGLDGTDPLTVVFHEDYESLEAESMIPDPAGYYDFYSQSIHLVPDDPEWELIFLHEYTHFLSHEYSQEQNMSATRLPQWFEEGIADYFGGESTYWIDPASFGAIDFYTLDSYSGFHESASYSFDPYVQGFLAVNSIADDHGEAALQQLLASESPISFYEEMESITGKDIEAFRKTFLEDEIEAAAVIADLFEEAYDAFDREQFADAKLPLEEIVRTGGKYDADQALWMLTDVHLELGETGEAVRLLETKLETGDSEFRTDDLLLLAEVYLLTDPAESLEIVKKVKEETGAETADDMGGYYYMDPDSLIKAYGMINSGQEAEGYTLLFEEGLLMNTVIWEKLEEQLKKKYPNEF